MLTKRLDAALKSEVDRSTSEDDAIKLRVDALESQDAGNNMGDLSLLLTDEKGSLTGAINEVDTQQGNIATMVGLTETPAVGGATFNLDLSAANYIGGSASVQAALIGVDAQVKSLMMHIRQVGLLISRLVLQQVTPLLII